MKRSPSRQHKTFNEEHKFGHWQMGREWMKGVTERAGQYILVNERKWSAKNANLGEIQTLTLSLLPSLSRDVQRSRWHSSSHCCYGACESTPLSVHSLLCQHTTHAWTHTDARMNNSRCANHVCTRAATSASCLRPLISVTVASKRWWYIGKLGKWDASQTSYCHMPINAYY